MPVTNILCQTKNWFLCRHKSFWRGTKCSQIFGLTQKIWTSTKHFATCKRTRHKSSKRWVGGPKKVKNMMTQYLNGHLEFGQNSRIRRHQLKIIDYIFFFKQRRKTCFNNKTWIGVSQIWQAYEAPIWVCQKNCSLDFGVTFLRYFLETNIFLKFIYSEKATKFCEISTLLLTGTT